MTASTSLRRRVLVLALASIGAVSAHAQTTLSMWYHGAGNPVEKELIAGIIKDFNGSQKEWKVELQQFPQEAYNTSVVAAAVAGKLPDILDVDGPVMPNWAWSKYMQPLALPAGTIDKFLPGTIGKYNGKVYSVGLWDAACAIFARKSVLTENKIRIPTLDKPWDQGRVRRRARDAAKERQVRVPDRLWGWRGRASGTPTPSARSCKAPVVTC